MAGSEGSILGGLVSVKGPENLIHKGLMAIIAGGPQQNIKEALTQSGLLGTAGVVEQLLSREYRKDLSKWFNLAAKASKRGIEFEAPPPTYTAGSLLSAVLGTGAALINPPQPRPTWEQPEYTGPPGSPPPVVPRGFVGFPAPSPYPVYTPQGQASVIYSQQPVGGSGGGGGAAPINPYDPWWARMLEGGLYLAQQLLPYMKKSPKQPGSAYAGALRPVTYTLPTPRGDAMAFPGFSLTAPTVGGMGLGPGSVLGPVLEYGLPALANIAAGYFGLGEEQTPSSLPVPGTGYRIDLPAISPEGTASARMFGMRAPRATPQRFMVMNPVTGAPTFFGPLGRCLLFSGDVAAARRVQKVARLAGKGRRRCAPARRRR